MSSLGRTLLGLTNDVLSFVGLELHTTEENGTLHERDQMISFERGQCLEDAAEEIAAGHPVLVAACAYATGLRREIARCGGTVRPESQRLLDAVAMYNARRPHSLEDEPCPPTPRSAAA